MLHALVAAALASASGDSILLRVLTINDFHGALEARVYPWSDSRPVGGIAALKATMDSLAGECRCAVVRLDAGDQYQGSLASNLVYGRSTIEAMNLLGLDAAAIGNHDLDWGIDTLISRIREARYSWLASNIIDSVTRARPAWAKPWAMITVGSYRIAVIGYLTPRTKTIVMDRHVRGLHFTEGLAAFADALAEAKAARPDFTMIVAHEGARCDGACNGEIVALAQELDSTEVDFIVAGHTHTLINTVVRGIPIVSARATGTAIGVGDLVLGADGRRQWRTRVETVYADRIRPDSAALALVARYRPRTDSLANLRIVVLADSLLNSRTENPLGNLIAEAQRQAARADFGLMNNGGIRRSLLPGPITYSDLFELHPFGNVVVRLELTGALLKEVLEHVVEHGAPDSHVAGMVVRYDPARPVGDRVVSIRRLRGGRVSPRGRYTLALSDFLAGGGGGFAMLRPVTPRSTNRTDLETLLAWLKRQPQPIRAPAGRHWIKASGT